MLLFDSLLKLIVVDTTTSAFLASKGRIMIMKTKRIMHLTNVEIDIYTTSPP